MASTVAYFEKLASGWSGHYQTCDYFQQRLATVLAWLGEETRPLNVLDYGCGSGVFVRALLDRGCHVTGVDNSPAMIEAVRRSLVGKYADKSRCRLEQVDGADFSGSCLVASYDCVLCLGVLEYVDDYAGLLERLTSMVAPGGSLIVAVPNKVSLARKLERMIHRHPWLCKKANLFPELTSGDSYLRRQVHQFSGPRLNRDLSKRGLTFQRGLYHVIMGARARSWIVRRMAHHPLFGMTLIAQYRKQLAA